MLVSFEGSGMEDTPARHDVVVRLKRIEGQIRGLQHMVEADNSCIDVITQMSAVTKALQSVAVLLLEDQLTSCVTRAADGTEGALELREATAAIARLAKL